MFDRREQFESWEDMHIGIWGPHRQDHQPSRPLNSRRARGGVLITSNKRDVVDAIRDVRAKTGPLWVFDPQAIALEYQLGG